MQQQQKKNQSLSIDNIFSSISSFKFISFVYFCIILIILVFMLMIVLNTNTNVNDLENALNYVKSSILKSKDDLCMDYVNLYNQSVDADKQVADVKSACDYTKSDEFQKTRFKENCCKS